MRVSERRQANEKVDVIRLYLRFVCRLISADLAAFVATVDDDIPLLRIGLYLDRTEDPAAGIGAVTGVDIDV